MPKHFPLSPSASSRWLECPGSLDLTKDIPSRTSVYAEEGTQAHELLAAMLLNDEDDDLAGWEDAPKEMRIAVNECWAFIDGLVPVEPHSYGVEEQFTSERIEGLGGTIDYWCITDNTLHVVDFKYGAGVRVHAKHNTQLMCYLTLLREQWPKAERFFGHIVQPRIVHGGVDSHEFGREELDRFTQRITEATDPAAKETFKAGSHCRFCPALSSCNHLHKETIALAREEFPEALEPEHIERLREILALKPAIKALLTEVPNRLLEQLKMGRDVRGYKAVKSLGNTSWHYSDEETMRILARRKLGKRIVTEAKLKSPTQLKRDGYAEQIEDLTHRPERGVQIVPETDRREAINYLRPEQEFSDLSFLD